MEVVQCTFENNLLSLLREEWRQQLADDVIGPVEYFTPHMEQAARIASENPTDVNYGIFAVRDECGSFHAMAHINHAVVPRTVRLVWQFLAPVYHGDEIQTFKVGPIIGTLFHGAWELHTGRWKEAEELKIYCPTSQDRSLIETAAAHLQNSGMNFDLKRGGSWIHINDLADRT